MAYAEHLLSLLKCMLHMDKNKRSKAGDLLKHPFVVTGKDFFQIRKINRGPLLADALQARLDLYSAIKDARLKIMNSNTMEKNISMSGSTLAIAGLY